MEKEILKLWFEERGRNCYVIRWDIWDLDLQIYYDWNNPDLEWWIWIIMMWRMTEKVNDLKHLKDIVKAWNKLRLTICY
jgi:hypothetical protein